MDDYNRYYRILFIYYFFYYSCKNHPIIQKRNIIKLKIIKLVVYIFGGFSFCKNQSSMIVQIVQEGIV